MAYTVKQVASMSGVTIRTLHFYDEAGLLRPAHYGANGYRYYEESQLLILQQILFYRELGFELKQIKEILSQPDFEKAAALESHRKALEAKLARTRTLIDTIDRTIQHLKGAREMKGEEMFTGFRVAKGKSRFDDQVRLAGEPCDCKLSAEDTNGAMCTFELRGSISWPRHRHDHQDEWIYVVSGELDVEIGNRRFRAAAGESVFLPRKVAHAWAGTGTIVNVYQPAGRMEEFFRKLGSYDRPRIHEVLSIDQFSLLFRDHGVELTGPPLTGEWSVTEAGQIVQIA